MDISHVVIFGEDNASLSEVAALLPAQIRGVCLSDPVALQTALQESDSAALILVVPATGTPERLNLPQLGPYLARTPLILVSLQTQVSAEWIEVLLAYHPCGLLTRPFDHDQLEKALVQTTSRDLQETLAETNRQLNARIQEINTVYTVGKSVASSLDTGEILERIIVPAVNLTQADSGFVILREGDQLFVHMAKHRDDLAPELLHAPTSDRIAWQVIRSGRPTMLHREIKIATDLLARAFLYVPLRKPGADVSGVLGVVNWKKDVPFTENQLFTLSTVADFAAVALENARLFSLREAEHSRLTAILQHAAEAIIVTNPADRLWLWSNAAARLFNILPEAQGQCLFDHVKNAELEELFSQISPETPFIHAEVNLTNGAVYNAQVSNIDGIGRIAVMQDITNLKELDRLKSEFVSTVSHDLRTPLTSIQGYIALLDRAGPLNKLQSDFVGTALASLDHITALISDLLDIGRIEAGYDLEMKPLRFDDLIEAAVETSQIAAREASIALTVQMCQAPLWVRGNARRLRQVLDNLISNAIKYNHSGGWVHVEAGQDSEHAIVHVSDSGVGIPLDEQSRIFDRFYRVQSVETENIKGTGLGLSIVKSVIEKHNGRIWVKSGVGKGSTFTFVLPTCEAES